jgi:leucyl-tRNA synthetase
MTLAPEHELVSQITTAEQKRKWMPISKNFKTFERERMADVKPFLGIYRCYAEHPFTKRTNSSLDWRLSLQVTEQVQWRFLVATKEIMLCEFLQRAKRYASYKISLIKTFRRRLMERKKVFNWSIQILNGLDYKKGTQKVIEELEK